MSEHSFEALESRVTELERRQSASDRAHKEFFDRIRTIETYEAVKGEKLETLMGKIDDIQKNVDMLTAAPGKRWNDLIDKVVFTAVGAIVAFIFSQIM